MPVRAFGIGFSLCIAALAAATAAAQDPVCLAFAKNGDGQWLATLDTQLPGKAETIKAGQSVSDEMQDALDARCVLSRK
jgi:hypothetical protein